MDYSTPGSSVHGILQARILKWFAMPFSRGCCTLKLILYCIWPGLRDPCRGRSTSKAQRVKKQGVGRSYWSLSPVGKQGWTAWKWYRELDGPAKAILQNPSNARVFSEDNQEPPPKVSGKGLLYTDLKQWEHLTLIEHLLRARHCSKCFVNIGSFRLYDNHESGTTSALT